MSPSATTTTTTNVVSDHQSFDPVLLKKANGNGSSAAYENKGLEDYNGRYQFAPIEEAEVSRAMIKR
ncbi:hypothetical protein EW145_g8179 [Phellinidium pouzarii]|uniref:Uncharacterized protein n=1 Tax=Phellinidium pouzarii TaxID=167371 RepID=A0A4S4K9Q0_9AGAM|nr:hypothetical protein EW145_g8179 [Phellinidium pouzarii]